MGLDSSRDRRDRGMPQQMAGMPMAPAPGASLSTYTYELPCDLFTEKGNNRPGVWTDQYDGLAPGSRQMLVRTAPMWP